MSDRRQEQVSRAHEPIGPLTSDTMDETRAAVFTGARPLLFAIAYRMLGSVADAEDLVQDAYLRWQQAHGEEIRAPHAYLTTIVTRLAINQLQSARHQRESYVGPWLPEPLVTEDAPDPAEPIELAESLSMAFMLMLERLSPIERAVLLLHDVFDFEYGEIARIVDKSEANCRQLLSRAKKHLGKAEARFDADPAQAERLLQRFNTAANAGDFDGMVAVLAEDITLWTDGGGKARGATLTPIHGAENVARFMAGVGPRYAAMERTIRAAQINGQPGFLVYVGGRAHAAVIFEVRDARIQAIYSISNPDKLETLPDLT
ncbi:MAG TPA: RNA polymerase sigma-70 factor [Gemmatimonadaceae bacterium]|nr:RNA polymerase sigma-70 factor [Gemmatimonadaceae bacterium]